MDATHTIESSPFAKMDIEEIGKLIHPKHIQVDKKADRYVSDIVFNIKNIESNRTYFRTLFKSIAIRILHFIKKYKCSMNFSKIW